MHILYGIIAIAAGFAAVANAVLLQRWLGRIGPAEQYFGPGGTLTAWKLLGLAAILGGFWELVKG